VELAGVQFYTNFIELITTNVRIPVPYKLRKLQIPFSLIGESRVSWERGHVGQT